MMGPFIHQKALACTSSLTTVLIPIFLRESQWVSISWTVFSSQIRKLFLHLFSLHTHFYKFLMGRTS